ncbi:MAG: 4Fe-4S binding protein [Magnetococcales bacterium]|nr:4Fe-4S binding protein [Magnetococcales bacterium]
MTQTGFFLLFLVAPPLDLFRLDLEAGHFFFLGVPWTLGFDPWLAGAISTETAVLRLVVRGFLPVLGVVGLFLFVSWRWGRLYCGWLCPHFAVVEVINDLMEVARGAPTLWESPASQRRGSLVGALFLGVGVAGFALVWAVALLTYLLSPLEVYGNLLNGTLTRNQGLFLGVATLVLALDFALARHLFCRFGCAVGFFQSLAWMANRRALVVGFDRRLAEACVSCPQAACERVCPMRLVPRGGRRRLATCTQCSRCLRACALVQPPGREPPLTWRVAGEGSSPSRSKG